MAVPVAKSLFLALCMVRAASFHVKSKAWSGDSAQSPLQSWPEASATRGTGSAVLFSGGGTRAFSSGLGETRALKLMGLLDKVEYMTGISGGAWFTSAFIFDQRSEFSDAERLCPYFGPEELDTANLEAMPEGCLGAAAQNHLYKKIAEYVAEAKVLGKYYTLDQVWIDAVHSCFLGPFGISKDAIMAMDESTVADIKSRNWRLKLKMFQVPREDVPYMVLGGTMIGPHDMNPFKQGSFQYVLFDMTPLYSGFPVKEAITYESKAGDRRVVQFGGLVESFAFGGVPQSSMDNAEGTLSVEYPANTFSVARAAGISSMAPTAAFEQITNSSVLLINETFFAVTDPVGSEEDMVCGDGGIVDNFGMFSMLRRGVSRIMVFVNSETPLASNETWDPTARAPSMNDIDGYITALFGVQVYSDLNPAYWTQNNQVFPQEDFTPLAVALQAAQASGTGAVAKVSLTTVENQLMGVPGGHKVELGVYYLSMPTVWKSQLPATVQADLDDPDGPYPDFPHYSTSTMISLSEPQVNLLTNMLSWTMLQNEALVSSVLNTSV